MRKLPTLLQIKANIKAACDKIEDYTTIGERKYNIILLRIRHRYSSLRADLFNVNIVLNPSCICGAPSESAEQGIDYFRI